MPLKSYNKPALTFDLQLDQLIARGLSIDKREQALKALSQISYYRLSAYWYPFRQRDKSNNKIVLDQFEPNTHIKNIIGLYELDRQLRLLVVDAVERIEVMLRTALTYHFGHKYGAFGHTNAKHFHNKFDHPKWLKTINDETERSKEEFIRHYQANYDRFPTLPIWMLTEIMSLGALSVFYNGMTSVDKQAIAAKFSLHYKCLTSWLHMLTYVRNICAHHSRLWNRELAIKSQYKPSTRDWLPPITPRNDRIFYVLLVLRSLLSHSDNHVQWKAQCENLLSPIAANRRWQVAMGMPSNWQTHPLWL